MQNEWNGQAKEEARRIALDFRSSTKYVGVFLPGKKAKCVRLAVEKGTITVNKPLFFVERRQSLLVGSRQVTTDLNLNSTIYPHELETLRLDRLVDLAYLDLMGSISQRLFDWLRQVLIPHLAPTFRISLLFTWGARPRIPFLEAKHREYQHSDDFFKMSFTNDCQGRWQIATYLCLLNEIFQKLPCSFVRTNGRPYFAYKDNVNPVVLYTVQSFLPTTHFSDQEVPMSHKVKSRKRRTRTNSSPQTNGNTPKPSQDLPTLLGCFEAASGDYDKMRGWKRSLTLYCRNRATEKGTSVNRIRASVKAQLNRQGYDTSMI